MRVVTVTAGHFAETKWVGARPVGLRPRSGVATVASLLLSLGIKDAVPLDVYLVTTRASHILFFVRATKPAQSAMGLVAIHADLVLLYNRRRGRGTKGH